MAVSRNYFQKFPSISYADYVVRDVSVRAKLTQYVMESGLGLLPYTIKEGERADNIANFYYDDPYYAWAIYLANGIIDPYQEWPKDQNTLISYLEDAYGSIDRARDTIVRYENDWASDTTVLSPDEYDALPAECKKYWDADFGFNKQIISYHRRPVDWVLDNNRIDRLEVVHSNNQVNAIALNLSERLYQYNGTQYLGVKSTVVAVSNVEASNTVTLASNATDIAFTSNSTVVTLKGTGNILPTANIVGTGIPGNTIVTAIINGTAISISAHTTASVSSNSTYYIYNPSRATLVVNKVDFDQVTLTSNGATVVPDSFFTYYESDYQDTKNKLVSRETDVEMIVLSSARLDNTTQIESLIANSHLSTNELKYWKSVNAYDDEFTKNEKKKEIVVLDQKLIEQLNDSLETLVKNG